MAPQQGDGDPGFASGDTNPTDGIFSSPTTTTTFYYPPSIQSSLPDPTDSTESAPSTVNVPLIALSLSLAAFTLICLSICACAYRRAKRRDRNVHSDRQGEYLGLDAEYARNVSLTTTPSSSPLFPKSMEEGRQMLEDQPDQTHNHHYQHRHRHQHQQDRQDQHVPPPAYSPRPTMLSNSNSRGSSRRSLRGPPPAALNLTATPTLVLWASPALASAATSPAYSLSSAGSLGLSPREAETARLLAVSTPPTPPPPMYVRD